MHTYGKLRMEKQIVDNDGHPVVIGIFYDENNVEWHTVFRETPSNWYVAIDDNGLIESAECDGELSQMERTIIGLDDLNGYENHDGDGSVYGKYWDGTSIVASLPKTVTENITEVPTNLTGGPTLKEVFSGNT